LYYFLREGEQALGGNTAVLDAYLVSDVKPEGLLSLSFQKFFKNTDYVRVFLLLKLLRNKLRN
jgi:hypothetical protein